MNHKIWIKMYFKYFAEQINSIFYTVNFSTQNLRIWKFMYDQCI